MKCDGVLFDLDGTLWDATVPIAKSWATALEGEPGVDHAPTVQELEGVMGMTAEDLTAALFPGLDLERRMELFDKCCQAECVYLTEHGGRLYEGIPQLLEELSQRLPLFIVSNCNLEYIPSFLDGHRLHRFFKDWECIGRTGKPKWENIRLVVERNHLQAPVYVGDTAMDQEAAGKAGVPFFHAAYGFGKVQGAAARLEKPLDLLALV